MKGLLLLVSKSIREHALSSWVTIVSIGLGCGLTMAIMVITSQAERTFSQGDVGFDAVLGARGSALQLVLNTVFHLETSPGNIPWSLYRQVAADPRIAHAIPYAVGDNYRGYRIVGTVPELFSEVEVREGEGFRFRAGGRVFHPDRMEAIVGSTVAQESGLRVSSTLNPYHGIEFDESARHDEQYTVVGVLEPTNSPSDRVIWIPIEGIFRMGGHVLRGSGDDFRATEVETIPDEHKEVSAVMLEFADPNAGFSLDQLINKQGKVATLAWPIGASLAEIFRKLGWIVRVLELVAVLVVLVAAGTILASITNTMRERRREFAILRALGARRRTVFAAILLESTTLALLGAVVGFAVHAGIVLAAASLVRAETGVVLTLADAHPALLLVPLGVTTLGALAGVIPARSAYGTDVANTLAG
ncbi:MAG: ABC transporter permease [Planctomycetota bacterium]|jgi:putative ABC transport system permease protein